MTVFFKPDASTAPQVSSFLPADEAKEERKVSQVGNETLSVEAMAAKARSTNMFCHKAEILGEETKQGENSEAEQTDSNAEFADDEKSSSEQIIKKNKPPSLLSAYRKIETFNRELFKSRFISTTNHVFDDVKYVDNDCFEIVDAQKNSFEGLIGASHVSDNIVVCVNGRTPQGQVKLGLANITAKVHGGLALKILHRAMVEAGCEKKALKTYLVGGQLPHSAMLDHFPGTHKAEKRFLACKEKYAIKGVRLHCNKPNEVTHVVMHKDGILCRKEQMW